MSPTQPNINKKWTNIPNFQLYKNKKEPLPPASNPNLKVNANWNENIINNTPQKRRELLKTYKPFTISELDQVINKMKRKAPGHDELTLDCFKELGYGGKHKFLDIANHQAVLETGTKALQCINIGEYNPIRLLRSEILLCCCGSTECTTRRKGGLGKGTGLWYCSGIC